MFRILGLDGSVEGPVSLEVLRQRVANRQLAPESRIQAEGSPDWQPLTAFPELAEALRQSPSLPPPLSPSPPSGRPPPIAPGPTTLRPRRRTSQLAIATLILGAVGFCSMGLTALVGLPLGIAALRNIRRSQGNLAGRGLAWIGVAFSVLSLVLAFVALGFLLPFLARMKFQSNHATCVNNLKQVALAVRLQADVHDGKFPPAATWSDDVQPHLNSPNQLRCPDRPRLVCAYAYNRSIAGRTTSSVPPETVMLFESDLGWNATAGPEDRFIRPPHGQMYSVAFADGSVRQVSAAELRTLRWEP